MTNTLERPLVEQALTRLRQDLLTGVHEAGTKLKIDRLQQRYGYSSSPLREALNRLTHEGLVVADERRGFRAAPMSLDDFADITKLRLLVDGQGISDSIRLGGDDWESQSVAAFHRLQTVESRMPEGPLVLNDEWSRLHRHFHMTLLSASGSPRLQYLSASLFDQAERYRRFAAERRVRPRSKSEEHQAILNAAMDRDSRIAGELLERHICRTQEDVSTLFKRS